MQNDPKDPAQQRPTDPITPEKKNEPAARPKPWDEIPDFDACTDIDAVK